VISTAVARPESAVDKRPPSEVPSSSYNSMPLKPRQQVNIIKSMGPPQIALKLQEKK
jgi:hypothetical protein